MIDEKKKELFLNQKKTLNSRKNTVLLFTIAAGLICIVICVCLLFVLKDNETEKAPDSGSIINELVEVRVAETKSDTIDSFYRVETNLPGTDFSSLGQVLEDKIKKEWESYDGMSFMARISSSHIFGIVDLDTDTWKECEEVIGLAINNPLESMTWLNKSGYCGVEGNDPYNPLQHVHVIVDAAQQDRKPRNISITSGYNTGSVMVTLTATVQSDSGKYNITSIEEGFRTYKEEQKISGRGAKTLVVKEKLAEKSENFDGHYYDVNAYWVENNVFYSLKVFGDAENKNEVESITEQIIQYK